VEKYMREIYGERRMEGVWGEVVPLPTEGPVWKPWGLCPFPEKNANYMLKRLNLVHILCTFVTSTFQHSKLPRDLFQAPGAGRLTPVSGRLTGFPGDSREFRKTWDVVNRRLDKPLSNSVIG